MSTFGLWVLIMSASSNTSATVFPVQFNTEADCNAVKVQIIEKSSAERGMAYVKAICVRAR